MKKISSQDYCRNFVREEDYNLYLLHFFVPRQKRQSILAVMALHTELNSIPKKVQDPMMRIIRLKWWHDEIKKIMKDKPHSDSPILDEITSCCDKDISWDEYFKRFEQSMRGEQSDIGEALYDIFGKIIGDKKVVHKFSKRLARHDEMDDDVLFRALRLWLTF